jgi:hypothetical protein
LHDLWSNKNVAFYSNFYHIVYQPNPNWLATFVMALLMFVVNGFIAEKIFLTAYILLFISGFYLLLKKISGINLWLLVLLLFVFPHTLAKGFYNFSFSIAFYFWVVWCWLCFLNRRNMRNGLLFFFFLTLLFFTHLLSFVFGAFTCAALLWSCAAAESNGWWRPLKSKNFIYNVGLFLFFYLPFVVLSLWFTEKQGGLQLQLKPHLYRLIELLEFKYAVNITHAEDLFAEIAGALLTVLFGISLITPPVKRAIHKYDGLLLSLLFVLFVYVCFPEAYMGRLILTAMRVQPFVFILATCCIAYRFPAGTISKKSSWTVLVCFTLVFSSCISYQCWINTTSAPGSHPLSGHIFISAIALLVVLAFTIVFLIGNNSFDRMKIAGSMVITLCFIALSVARFISLLKVSSATEDYLSAGLYIQPGKVVLPLDFSPEGLDGSGKKLADRNFLFVHTADYLGIRKPLILQDNFEANMGYFPVSWNLKADPYAYFNDWGGVEGTLSCASIKNYKTTTGVAVDYVLMWCYDPVFLQNERFARLYAEIQADYHLVYVSQTRHTMLYALNISRK